MENSPIKAVKNGEYIKRSADAKRVYIRGQYCRANRAYECMAADDINKTIYIKPEKIIFFGFTY